VELDPNYARAYTGIANCESYLKSIHGADISVEEILANADRALAIDPNLAEAYAARGVALGVFDHRAEAVPAYEHALEIDPDCYEARYYYARYLAGIGEFAQATNHYLRAMEIQPDDYESPLFLAQALISLGRNGEAREYGRIGLKRAEEALRLNPEDSRPAQLNAVALAWLGERERSMEWLARALAIDPDDNIVRYNAACAYALLGESGRAIDLLEIWIRKIGAPDAKLWFKNDPDFDSIRGHSRYRKLLELAG
jgi:adenylate cyclase